MDSKLIETIYAISEEYDVIMKNHIVINKDVNVILFAHYCSSDLFYKHFFKVSKEVFKVNNMANRNLKVAKVILKLRKCIAKFFFLLIGCVRKALTMFTLFSFVNQNDERK